MGRAVALSHEVITLSCGTRVDVYTFSCNNGSRLYRKFGVSVGEDNKSFLLFPSLASACRYIKDGEHDKRASFRAAGSIHVSSSNTPPTKSRPVSKSRKALDPPVLASALAAPAVAPVAPAAPVAPSAPAAKAMSTRDERLCTRALLSTMRSMYAGLLRLPGNAPQPRQCFVVTHGAARVALAPQAMSEGADGAFEHLTHEHTLQLLANGLELRLHTLAALIAKAQDIREIVAEPPYRATEEMQMWMLDI